jgi:hypothetical protein
MQVLQLLRIRLIANDCPQGHVTNRHEFICLGPFYVVRVHSPIVKQVNPLTFKTETNTVVFINLLRLIGQCERRGVFLNDGQAGSLSLSRGKFGGALFVLGSGTSFGFACVETLQR